MMKASNQEIYILIVDDRPENLLTVESLLEQPHRKFIRAASGNEALKAVLKYPIGLILLDVQMPEMDGYEVAQLLKANPQTEDISIIFITAGSRDEQSMLHGFDVGAVDYLYKPLDTNSTRAKVKVFETLYFQRMDLKNYINQIEQLNKKLDKFVHIVSHDIKAPLGNIHALLEYTLEDAGNEDKESVQENIRLIDEQILSLREMVNGILAYSTSSRKQEEASSTDTRTLIDQVLQLIAPAEKVVIQLEGDFPVLTTQKLKLQQVLQNLISNAIKYNDKEQVMISIACNKHPDHWEFVVSDNGPGIAKENHQKVFEMFATINPISKTESTGIGLSIVQSIVEDKGGSIWIESEPGQGAAFHFTWN